MPLGELFGESSKSANRPRKEGVLVMRDSTVDGLVLEDLRGVSCGDMGFGLATSCLSCFEALGERSGDREGNDSSVLADVGVARDCFLEPALTVPDLREAVDIWEDVRSRFLSLLDPAIFRYVCRSMVVSTYVSYNQKGPKNVCGPGLEVMVMGKDEGSERNFVIR